MFRITDIAQKSENSETLISRNYKKGMGVKVPLLPLTKFSSSQKLLFFGQNLSDIHEDTSCASSSNFVILIVSIVDGEAESPPRKKNAKSVVGLAKWKNRIRIMSGVDLECSICQIGKAILMLLCIFQIPKIFSSYDKLEYKKSETMMLEPSIWQTIICETIAQIIVSPGVDENLKMFCHALFKIDFYRMDSMMSPEKSVQKLHTKGLNPKENVKGRLADSANFILLVLGWSGDYHTETMEIFDATAQKWLFFRNEPEFLRAYHGVALFGCKLYIIGGFNGISCLDTTICLNLKSRRKSRKSPMSVPRCYVVTIAYRGYIYAFGGHNGVNRLKSCERFDPRMNRWTRFSDMMFRRSDASGAELNGRIFICGGFDGFQFHDTVEMYNPQFDDWTLIGRLLNPRSGHSMVSYDGELFVLGGFNGFERLQEVEKYNAETNQWEECIPMLTGRSNFCCIVFEQEIYAIGGYSGTTTIDKVEVFNKNFMSWQQAPSLKIDRSAAAACIINNSANITACAQNDFVQVASTDIEEPSP